MKASRLGRAFLTVSGLTGVSRILGFLRDILLAAVLGDGRVADAWHAAFTLPNVFRRTFAEGAMQAAFVPLLRGKLETEGEEAAKRFGRQAFTALLLVLTPLSIALILAMPWLVDLMTRFEPGSDRFELAVIFGRIMFPYLMLMTIMAYVGSILNTLDRFGPMALAPSMLNLILVALLSWLYISPWMPGHVLSWGVLAAGFAQIAVVWWPARAMGWAPALAVPKGVGPFFMKMLNGIVANGGLQISALIVLNLATTVEGDYTRLQYANRLYQLPLGLIGIALGTVLIASLSRLIERDERTAARAQINRALEISLLLSIPVTLACLFQADFLMAGLFQVGNFGAEPSAGAALALIGYAIGIPAAVGQKVLQPAFFARQDTRSPMYHSLAAVGIAVLASYLLYPSLGIMGLAVAASLSSWFGFVTLGVHTGMLGYFAPDRRLVIRLLPITLAAGVMVLGLTGGQILIGDMTEWRFAWRFPATFSLVLLSIGIYFALAFLFGAFNRADLQFLRKQT